MAGCQRSQLTEFCSGPKSPGAGERGLLGRRRDPSPLGHGRRSAWNNTAWRSSPAASWNSGRESLEKGEEQEQEQERGLRPPQSRGPMP